MPGRVEEALEELVALVESARAVPLSASCVLPREQVLDLLDRVRAALPEVISDAEAVVAERDEFLERARADSGRLVAAARAEAGRVRAASETERDRLVSANEIYRAATVEAERIAGRAEDRAAQRRGEVDDYVDVRLAAFADVLRWTLRRVERGRETMRARGESQPAGSAAAGGGPAGGGPAGGGPAVDGQVGVGSAVDRGSAQGRPVGRSAGGEPAGR